MAVGDLKTAKREGTTLVAEVETPQVSPELQAARERLEVWGHILSIVGDVRIPLREHASPLAKRMYELVVEEHNAAQVTVNELLPADGSLGPPGPTIAFTKA